MALGSRADVTAFENLLHQINAATRTIEFIAQ
jgi:hypothetical protein